VKDFRRDQQTAAIALHYLQKNRPRFLSGLGEPDEFGHRGDYRGYLRALAYADNVIGRVAATLAGYEREGRRTTLLVTTDHGRSHDFTGHGKNYPESAQVWLVAAGWGVRPLGVVAPSEHRSLADVATTIRLLGGLERPKPDEPLVALLQPAALGLAVVWVTEPRDEHSVAVRATSRSIGLRSRVAAIS
jgi:bisphosphoglycerate-independent phosphoglycerate mutase (AlkP superfamily)